MLKKLRLPLLLILASLALFTVAKASIPLASNFQLNSALPLDNRDVVANVTARNAIPAGQRYDGMIIYDSSTKLSWQLQGGILNSNWTAYAAGTGGGGGTSVLQSDYATTAALGTNTYSNGTSGVGATITITASGVCPTLDGVTPVLSDRVLIKDEGTQSHNGVYSITTIGTVSTSCVYTRTTDANTSAQFDPQTVQVALGSTNGNTSWDQTTVTPVIGTDNIVYLSSSGTFVSQLSTGTQTANNIPFWTGVAKQLNKGLATFNFNSGTGVVSAPSLLSTNSSRLNNLVCGGTAGASACQGGTGSMGIIDFQNAASNTFAITSAASTSANPVFTMNARPSAAGDLLVIQKTGTQEAKLDTNGGWLAQYFLTPTANPASAGTLRLANTDLIEWRNGANSANDILSVTSGNLLQYNSDTVCTLTAAQTLQSKVFGDATTASKAITFATSGATASTTMTIASNQTANRTMTLQDATDTIVGRATTDTLTNKSIDGGTNTLTNIPVSAISSGFVKTNGTTPLTANWGAGAFQISANSVLVGSAANQISGLTTTVNGSGSMNHNSSGTITVPNATDTLVGRATVDTLQNKVIGDATTASKALTFSLSGATATSTMTIASSQTANRTMTLQDATDTIVARATTDTLTNKTIAAGSNTITGLTNSNLTSAAISNANLATMAAHTVKSNITGATAAPSDNALTSSATASSVVQRDSSGKIFGVGFDAGADFIYNVKGLKNISSQLTVDASGEVLDDTSGVISVDWQNRHLRSAAAVDTLNWGTMTTKDSASHESIDWDSRFIEDSSLVARYRWDTGQMNDGSGNLSIDTANRFMPDSSGNTSVDWQNRQLNDTASATSINWGGRQLSFGGTPNLTWNTPAPAFPNGLLSAGDVLNSHHYVNNGATPSPSVLVAFGAGATTTLVNGTDNAGLIRLNAGVAGIGAGAMVQVNYVNNFPANSYVTISPQDQNTAGALSNWFITTSNSGFTFNTVTPVVPGSVFNFFYIVQGD